MFSSKLTTLIYDGLLEPLLKSLKNRVADLSAEYQISPLLDLCSGTGKQCHYFNKHGIASVDVDLDKDMVSFASKKYSTMPFVLADASQLPIKTSHFKGAAISFALHDKSPDLEHKIMRAAKSAVGKNGYIIILDFENP